MNDKEHGPVRTLVERAIGCGSESMLASVKSYHGAGDASFESLDKMRAIRVTADALDALLEREPDELLERAIASNREVLAMMSKPIKVSTWPQGDEAAEQLARTMGEAWGNHHPSWSWRVFAAAVLARLREPSGCEEQEQKL